MTPVLIGLAAWTAFVVGALAFIHDAHCKATPHMKPDQHDCGPLCAEHGDPRDTSMGWMK